MTAQRPHTRSRPLRSADARRLVVDLEHRGLDSHLISIEASPPAGSEQIGGADAETVSRPARRVAIGLMTGLAVGLVAGVVFALVSNIAAGMALMTGAIMGSALGALVGLYSRLSMHRNLDDVDGPGFSTVAVDLSTVDDDIAADVRSLIDHA